MKTNKNAGQISIFLCIVFTALMLSAFIAIDISRIASAEKQAARAVEYAGKSVLAKYSSYIKENFGLFAISKDASELEEAVSGYIAANLICEDGGDGVKLYDFRIESIKVTPVYNFTENGIVKKQILEYMKYRGVKEVVQEFINKIDAVRDTAKMSALYSEKTLLDAAWGEADKVLADLNGMIMGTGGRVKFYVNAYNTDDSKTRLTEEIADEILHHRELVTELAELNGELAVIKEKEDAENQMEERSDTQISALKQQIAEHEKEISDTRINILYLWRIFKEDYTEEFLSANRNALECSRNGRKLLAAARSMGESLKTLMALDKYCGGQLLGDLKDEILSEINNIDSIAGSEEYIKKIEAGLQTNIEYLENLIGIIEKYDGQVITAFDIPGGRDEITGALGGSESYCYIDYTYTHTIAGSEATDPRESAEEEVRENYTGNTGDSEDDSDMAQYGLHPDMLPSKNKIENVIDETGSGGAENIGNVVDFDDSGNFSRSAFDFWGSLGDALAGGIEDLRNDLYINEYIINMFGNASKSTVGKGILIGEVEYILHGKMSDRDNQFLTKGEILLARFGLNTLHVYMDTEKKTLSTAIATTVAGWWTGGAGIPIISNLIRCGWGMSEAVIDVSNLAEGKPVAFYKQKGDWVLQIGLTGAGTSYQKSNLQFTYEDYLRLLLLTVDEGTKISRIEDLICMNLAKNRQMYEMEHYCTGINIETEISVNYMFLAGVLESSAGKTADGRHIIKVVVYEGY